jgi:hypothetical protein
MLPDVELCLHGWFSGSGRSGQGGWPCCLRPLRFPGQVLTLGFGSPGVARAGQGERAGKGGRSAQGVRSRAFCQTVGGLCDRQR